MRRRLCVAAVLCTLPTEVLVAQPLGSEGEDISNDGKPATAACTIARYGGALVNVGPFCCEVFIRPSGQVLMTVRDDSNKIVQPLQLVTNVHVNTMHHGIQHVDLRWDATEHVFSGWLSVGHQPNSGMVEVFVIAFGTTHYGRSNALSLMPWPTRGGYVISAGNDVFELQFFHNGDMWLYPASEATENKRDGLRISAEYSQSASARNRVEFKWNRTSKIFSARANVAGKMQAGPLTLWVATQGGTRRGDLSMVWPIPQRTPSMVYANIGNYLMKIAPSLSSMALSILAPSTYERISNLQMLLGASEPNGYFYRMPVIWNSDTKAFHLHPSSISPKVSRLWFQVIETNLPSSPNLNEPEFRWSTSIAWPISPLH